MKGAIYSRKSKIATKGESIENQLQLCREYAINILKCKETDIYEYEDEGLSGKNTDRPDYQRMLADAKRKKFDVIICYRLDRVSRNIGDFATLIEELAKLNIGFVSIREQFDTSTPMGRAMMYIASIFAQLERETIAERVKDNMQELSKTGRWLGGKPPFGFSTYRTTEEGKEITYLEPNDDIEKVKEIYDLYLELGSMHQVQKYLYDKDGTQWILSSVKQILSAPYYVQSSPAVFNYLKTLNITVIGEPNGNGMLSYNKRPSGTTKRSAPSSEWIYAVSRHEGVIEPDKWIKVQKQMEGNRKQPRAATSQNSYLTGLLRCGKCKSPLTINYNHTRKDGSRCFYYVCEGKRKFGIKYCNNGNIRTEQLEQKVIDYLKFISTNQEQYEREVAATKENTPKKSSDKIKKAISKNEQAIQNLVKQLSLLSSDASGYIITEIERLSKENNELKNELLEIENPIEDVADLNRKIQYESVKNFKKAFKSCKTVDAQRMLISSIVEKITWDSESQMIDVKLLQY